MLKDLDKQLEDSTSASKETLYIILLAAIQFAHIVDFVVMMPLGPTLMRVLDVSPIQFASLVSSYSFSAAVAGVLYGVIADRFDRKKLLVFGFSGFIAGTVACGLTHDFQLLLSARIVAGCFGGILNGIVFAVVSDLIPFHRRGAALGVIMSAFSIASVLGVPLGLAIADAFGWQKAFWFIGAFAFPILLASFWVFPSLKDHIQQSSPLEDLKRFGRLLLNYDYFRSYVLILIIGLSTFMIIPFLAPYAVKNVGIQESDLKYVYLAGGLFTIVTSRLIGKATDKFGPFKMFLWLALFSFGPIILYTQAPPMGLALYLVLSTLFMSSVSGRFIPVMTMVTEISESGDRGTFMGLVNSIRALASALATLIAGAIVIEAPSGKLERFDHVGYLSIAFSVSAILMGLAVHRILKEKLEKRNWKDRNEKPIES